MVMSRMARPAVLLALLAAAMLLPAAPAAHPGHGATQVTVRDTVLGGRYSPADVIVLAGDDVVWIWSGQVRNHSVTAEPGQNESFDSDPGKAPEQIAQPPDRAFTHRFRREGTFRYFCKVHPDMRAEVEVLPESGISDTVAPRIRRARVLPRRGRLRLRVSERADVLARLARGRRTLRTFDFRVRKGRNSVRVPTRRLDAGRYRLRLNAFDDAGNESRRAVVRFRLG
jgi:plastocyanin